MGKNRRPVEMLVTLVLTRLESSTEVEVEFRFSSTDSSVHAEMPT